MPSAATPSAVNGWFLCSEDAVNSRDLRRHVDWILEKVALTKESVDALLKNGGRVVLRCFWLSAHGHGGPILSAVQCSRLGDLGIDTEFDIYFEL